MNSRIEIENQIKILSDTTWLFPSQITTYQQLLPFLSSPHRLLNLYGLQGVGKTFLARILLKESRVDYVTSPDVLLETNKPLVIDNAPFDRTSVRGMRNQMRKYSIPQIILITRYRVEDSVPTFALNLTPEDVLFFRSNLFRYFDFRLPDCSALNLWEHLKLIGGIYG